MRTAIVSYFYSFSAVELNNIENEDDVFAQECSYEQSCFWNSDDEYIKQLYSWQFK